jgi:phosphonate transport system substrate-binding protein
MTTRKRRRSLTLSAALLAGAAVLSACGSADASADEDTLRFAVTDLEGLEELQREFGAFVDVFEEKSGMDMEFFAVTDRTAAAAALENDEVDIVFTGPAEYIVLHERTNAEPVVALERPGYSSCVYTTTDSGINSLDDLVGGEVAMSDVGSTSGHLGPSQIFVENDIDPMEDLTVHTVGNTVHEALRRGDVDAVGIGCHDYEEFMETEDDPSQFVLLEQGEVLPPDVIMASDSVSDETVQLVEDTFVNNFDELLEAMLEGEDNAKFEGANLVTVEDSDYDVVRSMYEAIGATDFTEFAGE